MDLSALLKSVAESSGVQSKHRLMQVLNKMPGGCGRAARNGDDTAVLPVSSGINLFAAEGFIPAFVEQDLWFAGWCSVMVNCSDIAAMGGRPVAVTDTLWCRNDGDLKQMMQGICDASEAFGVPVAGGHTCQDAPLNQISVAVTGQAEQILSGFGAQPGDCLICAVDLRGHYRRPFLNWDAATHAPPERLRRQLALLPEIAALAGVSGAKDISQAGVLGTLAMFMECSGCGADIDLEAIPKPAMVSWSDWLQSFPSFGFLISCSQAASQQVISLFRDHGIAAESIGQVDQSAAVRVCYQHQQAVFWDFNNRAFMVPPADAGAEQKEVQICL